MTTQRKERDLKHALSPEPGDYWDEMLVGICVVLEVTDTYVVICKSKKAVDSEHWTWDLSKKTYLSRQEFKKWLEYDTMPNNFWASVNPRQHIWAVKETKKEDTMTNKLYLVKLRGMQSSSSITNYGLSYVVAVNTNDAYMKVKNFLEDNDIGFSSDRELDSVSLIAEQADYPHCKIKLYL